MEVIKSPLWKKEAEQGGGSKERSEYSDRDNRQRNLKQLLGEETMKIDLCEV